MRNMRIFSGRVSRLAVAVALCIVAMLAVYALAGQFTNTVLLGALIGFVLAMGNFISLCITVSNALDRTVKGTTTESPAAYSIVRRNPPGGAGHHLHSVVPRKVRCDPLATILPLLLRR